MKAGPYDLTYFDPNQVVFHKPDHFEIYQQFF